MPKERHVRKEGYGYTLMLRIGVMRGMTLHLVKVLIQMRDMSRQTGCVQYTKSSQNLGMILKRGIHL